MVREGRCEPQGDIAHGRLVANRVEHLVADQLHDASATRGYGVGGKMLEGGQHRSQLTGGQALRKRGRANQVYEAHAHALRLVPCLGRIAEDRAPGLNDVPAEQDVQRGVHRRYQRGRLGVGAGNAQPHAWTQPVSPQQHCQP